MPVHVAEDPLTCVGRGTGRPRGVERDGSRPRLRDLPPPAALSAGGRRADSMTSSQLANRTTSPPRHRLRALLVISSLLMASRPIQPSARSRTAVANASCLPADRKGAVHDLAQGIAPSMASAMQPRSTGFAGNEARLPLAENQRIDHRERPRSPTRPGARTNCRGPGSCRCKRGSTSKTTAATVIARESSEFRRLVVLDRGTNDGIAVGDVAVAAGGALAGRVSEVGPNNAKVALVTDSGSTVIGQLTTNATTGQVVGVWTTGSWS